MTIDYRIFDRDKFTVVGTPTITDDGIVSDWSRNNDIQHTIIGNNETIFEYRCHLNVPDSIFSNEGTGVYTSPFDLDNVGDKNWHLQGYTEEYSVPQKTFKIFGKGFNYPRLFILNDSIKEVDIVIKNDGVNLTISAYDQNNALLGNITSSENGSEYPIETLTCSLVKNGYFGTAKPAYQVDLKRELFKINGIEVFSGSHKGTLTDKLVYLNDTKQIIKSAIEAKGVEVSTETPFRQYANKIGEISGGREKNYYIVGNPTLSEDGILTNITKDDYVVLKLSLPVEGSLLLDTGYRLSIPENSGDIIFGSFGTNVDNYYALYKNDTNTVFGCLKKSTPNSGSPWYVKYTTRTNNVATNELFTVPHGILHNTTVTSSSYWKSVHFGEAYECQTYTYSASIGGTMTTNDLVTTEDFTGEFYVGYAPSNVFSIPTSINLRKFRIRLITGDTLWQWEGK